MWSVLGAAKTQRGYSAAGRRVRKLTPDGAATYYFYTQGGNLSFSKDYGYDPNGNLTGINDLVNGHNSQTLAYDGLNRLTEAHAPNSWGTEAYSYDPLNNMRSKLAANRRFTFNYDANNRLANMVVNGGVFSDYRYDTRGNRNYERILYTAHDDSFDARNQLLAVNGVASYVYDAQGRRIQKTLADGSVSHSFYDQAGRLMYAYDDRTGQATDYLYFGTRLIARWSAGAVTYLLTDRLGSPVRETNPAGAITANFAFRPYGTLVEGTPQNQPGFTGHVNDPETGLVYMQARYNDGSAGQSLSVDPVAPQPGDVFGFNRYAYANNNPVMNTDPDGREAMHEGCNFVCQGMQQLANAFGVTGNSAASGGSTGLDRGMAAANYYSSGASAEIAEGLHSAAPTIGQAAEMVPGIAAASCAIDGCGVGGWAMAAMGAIPGEGGVVEEAAPMIKTGSAFGESAGRAFSEIVKDSANAENPLKVCVYCRREGIATQVDHAIPRARGGNATLDNAQLACPHCNASKGARDFPVNPPPNYFGRWPPSHWGN